MTTKPAPPPPTRTGAPRSSTALAATSPKPVSPPTLAKFDGKNIPPRIVIQAVEGWGKTTAGSYSKDPVILMSSRETGYQTLVSRNMVPSVPCIVLDSWTGTLALLESIANQDTGIARIGTVVIDAIGGFERLCHEHVCSRDFRGEWGEKGFASYAKGYEVAISDWIGFLTLLDRIHALGVTIILLGHTIVKPFKNPTGEDFDRYVSDVHHKTWAQTHRWADAVLFGAFRTVTTKENGRAKGVGGTDRVLYTERRDSFDAKNRFGMPELLEIPPDPTQVWYTIEHYMNNSTNQNKGDQ